MFLLVQSIAAGDNTGRCGNTMKLHFGNPGDIDSIANAVSRYGTKEFESPTRSTIPMLSLLIHDMAKFKAIVKTSECLMAASCSSNTR